MEDRSLQEILELGSNLLDGNDSPSDSRVSKIMRFIAYFDFDSFLSSSRSDQETLTRILKVVQGLLTWTLRRFPSAPEVGRLERENRKLRKVIQVYQTSLQSTVKSSFQCTHCPKKFVDEESLNNHMQKRHPSDSIEVGLLRDTPLANRIAQLTAETHMDGDFFDRLTDEVTTLRSKIQETERMLTEEREARASLEQSMLQRLNELKEGWISPTSVMTPSGRQSPTAPAITHLENVMYKQLEQVTRIGKDIQNLNEKLESRTENVSKPKKPPVNIMALLDARLQELGISTSSTGVDEETYQNALMKIRSHRAYACKIDSTKGTTSLNSQSSSNTKPQGILKSRETSTKDSQKNDRRITFSDHRIEISPETTDEEFVEHEEPLHPEREEIQENEAFVEENTNNSQTNPIPKPRIRLSKETKI